MRGPDPQESQSLLPPPSESFSPEEQEYEQYVGACHLTTLGPVCSQTLPLLDRGNNPLDPQNLLGLTGGNVRRDAIRETGSSIFFLLTILHRHFQAKPPVKHAQNLKTPEKTTEFLGKWEKLSLDPLLL